MHGTLRKSPSTITTRTTDERGKDRFVCLSAHGGIDGAVEDRHGLWCTSPRRLLAAAPLQLAAAAGRLATARPGLLPVPRIGASVPPARPRPRRQSRWCHPPDSGHL